MHLKASSIGPDTVDTQYICSLYSLGGRGEGMEGGRSTGGGREWKERERRERREKSKG